ncbi:MAG: M24 family metallopeptidase [Patescibacteria group bacterium]
MDNKLQVCKETKQIALDALANTLKVILKKDKIAESEFRNLWLAQLRKSTKIFPNGWYMPPPNGIIVLFATDKDPKRVLYPNMRLEETWPRDDVYLDKTNGIIALYASPMDRKTGIIGDTEVMIYLSKNKEVMNTFKTCYRINREIFEFAQVGQQFSQVAKFANKLIAKNGLTNNVVSTSDPASVNLGHTIPVSYEDWTSQEKAIFKNGESQWENVCQIIAKKRKFVNEVDDFQIKASMAFTIEPRLRPKDRPNLPSTWTHSIVLIKEDGSKELFFGYEEIFKICGMDWALN